VGVEWSRTVHVYFTSPFTSAMHVLQTLALLQL
jgi:hypothetical protein